MIVIAGLGNPGKEYDDTKHNVGFWVIDQLAKEYTISVTRFKHKALIGEGIIAGKKVLLVKPQTYMNLSGESIREILKFYKIPIAQLYVIYDDTSLPLGGIRIREKGSAGGHNGIKNIIAHLGTQEFPRVRIGVGAKPDRMDLADYVLGRFPQVEQSVMEDAFKEAAEAAAAIVEDGIDAAMNRFNRKK